jgi:poly(hydroxyalkanoate) depolymerase family esterase
MNDPMNEITVFSPFGGTLILEEVKGANSSFQTPENSVSTHAGMDRSMYSYVPKSGCPDAKQCQVLMVLRDENDEKSAAELMKQLQLEQLAEERHFILLFPNPQKGGWNYDRKPKLDDDLAFLVRCFAALPKSKGGAAGFNGMIFYLAASRGASALLAVLSAVSPIDCSAVMLSEFPEGFKMPEDGLRQPQTAWVYGDNGTFADYLLEVNSPCMKTQESGIAVCSNQKNPNIRCFLSADALSAEEVRLAWDRMFSEARRWRNDTYGTYQHRTDFTARGFTGHVNDSSLGVNHGYAHTWYEYIPPQLRGRTEKAPLLFYFHGGNCIPLYGAEQSGWHDIADREGFIVIYPKASTKKRWNCWNDADEPSDFDFVLALIEHMKQVHPIDESRIYLSGFSMGSMMTNALACCYPDVFAAGAAFNAQNLGYFCNLLSTFHQLGMKSDDCTEEQLNAPSPCHLLADQKKAAFDYRMPLIQNSGLLDGLGMNGSWPISSADNLWLQTIDYWKQYNHIPLQPFVQNPDCETGLSADETVYEGDDQRFIHQRWFSADPDHLPLYQLVVAKRMPHAADLRQMEIAWEFLRHYRRGSDGTLACEE